jgi:hypothetical protein
MKLIGRAVVCAALVAGVAVSASAASAAPASKATVKMVVSGLDNPRDLAFARDGTLYLAEAGHGGTAACFSDPEFGNACIGFTSKISRVNVGAGTVTPIVRGLVSLAGSDGSAATGVDGISVLGSGRIYGIITGSALAPIPPSIPPAVAARAKRQLGRLIVASPSGNVRTVGDVGDRDFRWSAQHANLVPGQFPDANPYGVFAGTRYRWVVDAGSNTLDRVDAAGHVRVVKFFPNPPASDAVPTCVDRGPDGALYIGELTGGGNGPGASVVWRYQSGKLTKWATGLTAVTGCGFARDGGFYATEFSTLGLENGAPGTGALVRVPAHSSHPVTVVGGLNFPGGFAAGPGGALYVSDWSIAPAAAHLGSVLRITLGH